ncbi:hypothetical protein HDR66_01995 [bacterium]|nr:hypothetical protein [bacterium]
MNADTIIRLMKNAGFRVLNYDTQFVYIEDPTCILRSFATFAEYAWLAITCATLLLLFGWTISMIRGSRVDIFSNMKNLILIFGVVSAAGPIINIIYGDNLFARGCQTVSVPIADIRQAMDEHNKKLSPRGNDLYEDIDIYDSGAQSTEIY